MKRPTVVCATCRGYSEYFSAERSTDVSSVGGAMNVEWAMRQRINYTGSALLRFLIVSKLHLAVEARQNRLNERILQHFDYGLPRVDVRILKLAGKVHLGGDLLSLRVLEDVRGASDS